MSTPPIVHQGGSRPDDPGSLAAAILAATAEYRVDDCERLLARAREAMAPGLLIREVLSPVLREAGNRWHRGEFSVVQEHLLSNAIRRQLSYALDRYNQETRGPALVFCTLSGERHELGSLMLAVVAASLGFRTLYLGADLPPEEVGRFCARVPVDVVAISIVTHPDVIDVPAQLADLRRAIPEPIPLWLGGQAAQLLEPGQMPAHTRLVRDIPEFEAHLADLAVSKGSAT